MIWKSKIDTHTVCIKQICQWETAVQHRELSSVLSAFCTRIPLVYPYNTPISPNVIEGITKQLLQSLELLHGLHSQTVMQNNNGCYKKRLLGFFFFLSILSSSSPTLRTVERTWREWSFKWSKYCPWFQFSRSVVSDSLRPHESQHARPPCPSPTPGVYSNSCPSSR